ncbi:MAG: hypothetical protein IKE69_04715 [Thermoguttaceae bacterium]|nr:hypothetical protein [Thermoguttaceae bacterium]
MNSKTLCNVLQWKYTACRYNIENANGFHTFSMSEGITRDEKEELIYYAGNYIKPDSYSDRPTPEEIAVFPINFSSFKLRSGRRAIIQSRYVGQDYAGVRWGNFFSHALILSKEREEEYGYFWPFRPIQLWKSNIFSNGLTLEEQNLGRTPEPLPVIQIQESDIVTWDECLDNFFEEKEEGEPGNRHAYLKDIIDGLRTNRKKSTPVLLLDKTENIPCWIAAVQYAFPLKWSQEINFSTYIYSKGVARNYDLIGSVKGETEVAQQTRGGYNNVQRIDTQDDEAVHLSSYSDYTERIQLQQNFPGETIKAVIKDCEQLQWDADIFDVGSKSPETVLLFNQFIKDGREITPAVREYFLTLSLAKQCEVLGIILRNVKRFIFDLKDKEITEDLKAVFFIDLERVALRSENVELQKSFVNLCFNQFLYDLNTYCVERSLVSTLEGTGAPKNQPFNFDPAKVRNYLAFLEEFFEIRKSKDNLLAENLSKTIDNVIKEQLKKPIDRMGCLIYMLRILMAYVTKSGNALTEFLEVFNEHYISDINPAGAAIIYNAIYRIVIEKAHACTDFKVFIDFVFQNKMRYENKHSILVNLVQCLNSDYESGNWTNKQGLPKEQAILFMEYILKLKEEKSNTVYYEARFYEIKSLLDRLLFEKTYSGAASAKLKEIAYKKIRKYFPASFKRTIVDLFDHRTFYQRHVKLFLTITISTLATVAVSLLGVIAYIIITKK